MHLLFADGSVSISTPNGRALLTKILLDRETEETTFHVDIKSEWLRDVLRDVLKDVQVISLKEGKLSVSQPLQRNEIRDSTEIRSNKNFCFTIFLNSNHAKSGMRSLRSTSWAQSTSDCLLTTSSKHMKLRRGISNPSYRVARSHTTCSGPFSSQTALYSPLALVQRGRDVSSMTSATRRKQNPGRSIGISSAGIWISTVQTLESPRSS